MNDSSNEKDRSNTELKLLEALGHIIEKEGFEKVGVNSIATKAGVSKVLIYRYFGSIDEMILEYLTRKDFWINYSLEFPTNGDWLGFIKGMFRKQILHLREDKVSQRLHRFELSTNNSTIEKLRLKRESNGIALVAIVSQLSNHPQKEIAALATLLSAAITYLVMLSENCPLYNGIDLQTNEGWEQLASGIDLLVDKWAESK